jgi:putative sigma-54 modulation protein
MQIQIRRRNVALTSELHAHIDRRLQFSLGRFRSRLRSAMIHLEDLNGPKGGVDQECKLTIHTLWHREIVIEERDVDMFVAVARAAERAGRSVERQTAIRFGSEHPRPARVQFGD